jgi:predicted phosphate transport protein (TIGR00153 family)
MKLRILPREESYFDLFEAAADTAVEAAKLLRDMLDDFVDVEEKARRLVDCEHYGDSLTREVMQQLNTTFVTPFDREDIYALATRIDDVTDAIEDAGSMVVLHKVDEPFAPVRTQARLLERACGEMAAGVRLLRLRKLDQDSLRDYWRIASELEDEGDRIYRQATADLYAFSETEHPARYLLMWKDILASLEEAMDTMQRVAFTVETITIKHA